MIRLSAHLPKVSLEDRTLLPTKWKDSPRSADSHCIPTSHSKIQSIRFGVHPILETGITSQLTSGGSCFINFKSVMSLSFAEFTEEEAIPFSSFLFLLASSSSLKIPYTTVTTSDPFSLQKKEEAIFHYLLSAVFLPFKRATSLSSPLNTHNRFPSSLTTTTTPSVCISQTFSPPPPQSQTQSPFWSSHADSHKQTHTNLNIIVSNTNAFRKTNKDQMLNTPAIPHLPLQLDTVLLLPFKSRVQTAHPLPLPSKPFPSPYTRLSIRDWPIIMSAHSDISPPLENLLK